MVPHEQMPVVLVEIVEIDVVARTLADCPEGQFTKSSDLLQDVGYLPALGDVDGQIAALDELLSFIESHDLVGASIRHGDLGQEFLQALRRLPVVLGRLIPPSIGKHVDATTKILRERGAILELLELVHGDRFADGSLDASSSLVGQFPSKEHGPTEWVYEPRHLEESRVLSMEIDGNDGCIASRPSSRSTATRPDRSRTSCSMCDARPLQRGRWRSPRHP